MTEGVGEKLKVLLAQAAGAPLELVRPVVAAVTADDAIDAQRIDLGKIGSAGGRLGRVVQAIMGEAEAGRLMRALTDFAPAAAVGFDPGSVAALVLARNRRVSATPVVAVVPDLAPRRAWPTDADRYSVVDDEAGVLLAEQGVDGARVVVTGAIAARALVEAGREPKRAVRDSFKLPADLPVVLVDTRGLTTDSLNQVLVQVALFERRLYALFDAGDSADAAALVRRQVPALGIRGKLFGEHGDAPRLWRAADVVVARPRPRAIHAALAAGAALVALHPEGDHEHAEARALGERGLGTIAPTPLVLAASLERLVSDGAARQGAVGRAERRSRHDGAAVIADLVASVAAESGAVLAETFEKMAAETAEEEAEAAAAQARTAAAEQRDARRDARAGELEDLDDWAEPDVPASAGPPSAEIERLRAQVVGAEHRARRELDESRAEVERWEQRRVLAQAKGDTSLAEQAAREADRKRARMHAALEELSRLAQEKARLSQAAMGGTAAGTGFGGAAGSGPRRAEATGGSLDDMLQALKRKAQKSGKTVEDELAELKRKMERERKK